jgi:HAD superfamily hydrolase (TIGR01549 family)
VLVDAVIFDMDGTLLDSSATVPAAYAATIEELCGRRCTDDEIVAGYSLGPAAALLSHFIDRPATDADVECWLRHLEARLGLTTIYPGIVDAVGTLAAAGLRLAVFTGATRAAAELQLAHASLRPHLEAIVGSDEIRAVKPAPDGVLEASTRLGVPPDRVAYIGDARHDLACARAAGAVPVAAGWGHLYEDDDERHLLASAPSDLVGLLLGTARGD